MIRIETYKFEGAHRRKPRGRGTWAFEMSCAPFYGNRTDLFFASPNLTYSEACREARAEARDKGWTRIVTAS